VFALSTGTPVPQRIAASRKRYSTIQPAAVNAISDNFPSRDAATASFVSISTSIWPNRLLAAGKHTFPLIITFCGLWSPLTRAIIPVRNTTGRSDGGLLRRGGTGRRPAHPTGYAHYRQGFPTRWQLSSVPASLRRDSMSGAGLAWCQRWPEPVQHNQTRGWYARLPRKRYSAGSLWAEIRHGRNRRRMSRGEKPSERC
jgi:hypothetical protein